MKKVIIRFVGFLLCFTIGTTCLLRFMPDKFATSYQRGLVRQYDYLRSVADDEKIVFLGYSTMCFGLDMDRMEELSGKRTVILANQVSVGYPLLVEMSKEYLHPGDIVVMEVYDYDYWDVGVDNMLTGIGKRVELYRFIPKQMRMEVAARFPAVVKKNLEYILNRHGGFGGPYSAEGFDGRGNYVFYRDECVLSNPYEGESGWTDYTDTELPEDTVEALNAYATWCKEHDVTLYFTIPPVCEDVVKAGTGDEATMDARDAAYQRVLDAPLISRSKDYVFSRKYMWDAHNNTKGQLERTERLYQDINRASK